MMRMPQLNPRESGGGRVLPQTDGWILSIPSGSRGAYRLAQLDDCALLPRRKLPWSPPLHLHLRARLAEDIHFGTWGFGFWNDPFGFSLGFGATAGRLPALPQTAWFFYASPRNYLSLQEDAPGNGFFAGTFRAPHLPGLLLSPALLALPFTLLPPLSRLLRRFASGCLPQAGSPVSGSLAGWHSYAIHWQRESVSFQVDGQVLLETGNTPHPPLGLVIWIDNQYAAWRPDGRLGYGTEANSAAWLEIQHLVLEEA